jgi:hypothetical protein
VQPYAYYDYLNTLAVELGEVGRLEEARNASRIALATRFASAYPEWRETREEIELRGYRAARSTVAVSQRSFDNLMRLPAREPSDSLASGSLPPIQPARVLSFLEGKKKMVKESNGPPEEKRLTKIWMAKSYCSRSWSLPHRATEPITSYIKSWELLKKYCRNRKNQTSNRSHFRRGKNGSFELTFFYQHIEPFSSRFSISHRVDRKLNLILNLTRPPFTDLVCLRASQATSITSGGFVNQIQSPYNRPRFSPTGSVRGVRRRTSHSRAASPLRRRNYAKKLVRYAS